MPPACYRIQSRRLQVSFHRSALAHRRARGGMPPYAVARLASHHLQHAQAAHEHTPKCKPHVQVCGECSPRFSSHCSAGRSQPCGGCTGRTVLYIGAQQTRHWMRKCRLTRPWTGCTGDVAQVRERNPACYRIRERRLLSLSTVREADACGRGKTLQKRSVSSPAAHTPRQTSQLTGFLDFLTTPAKLKQARHHAQLCET